MDPVLAPTAPAAKLWRAVVAAGSLALVPSLALAADADPAQQPTPPPEVDWRDGLRLNFAVEGVPSVDFGDADVSWIRTTGRVALQGPVSDRWGLGVSLSAELLSSEVDAEPSFLAVAADGDGALRDLFESTFSVGARYRLGERFALGADGYLSAKLEPGADLSDALKGGSVLTLAYRRSDTFNLSAGVKLGSRFDRPGLFAWPVLRLEWQITDRFELAIQNATVRFAYAFWDGLELLVFGGAHTDRYRLERRAAGPLASDSGTLGYRGATVGLGLRWNATEHLRIVGNVGVAVWQRLLVADGTDDQIASRDMHGAAPVISLRVQARF